MQEWIVSKVAELTLGQWAIGLIPFALLVLNFLRGPDRKALVETAKTLWDSIIFFIPRVLAKINELRHNIENPGTVTMLGLSKPEVKEIVRFILVDEINDRIAAPLVDILYSFVPFYHSIMDAREKKLAASK